MARRPTPAEEAGVRLDDFAQVGDLADRMAGHGVLIDEYEQMRRDVQGEFYERDGLERQMALSRCATQAEVALIQD